jgi:hypothetical protein
MAGRSTEGRGTGEEEQEEEEGGGQKGGEAEWKNRVMREREREAMVADFS